MAFRRLQHGLTLTLALIILAGMTSSCFLFPKKKSSKPSAQALIDRESIYIDRVGDGTAALFKFKTKASALCELSLFSQDDRVEPTKARPKVIPCSGTGGRLEFSEQLTELKSDTLYFVNIFAWPDGGSKQQGETLLVREQPGGSNVGVGPNATADGKFQSLYVVRFNAPLRTAEMHRYNFPEPADVAKIKERLVRRLGCFDSVPAQMGVFNEADSDIRIKNVSTRGFASAQGQVHPAYPNRLRFYFNALQFGNPEWEWGFETTQGQIFKSKSAARFTTLEAESGQRLTLGEAQLAKPEDPLALDLSKPMKFSWQWENLPDIAYVSVQIGRSGQEKAVYCMFDAKRGSGEIDPILFAPLPAGRQVVMIQLESEQLLAAKGWLIRSVDWRSLRIEKP